MTNEVISLFFDTRCMFTRPKNLTVKFSFISVSGAHFRLITIEVPNDKNANFYVLIYSFAHHIYNA